MKQEVKKLKEYERIEQKDITHIELWKDVLRIHLVGKEVIDLNVNQDY